MQTGLKIVIKSMALVTVIKCKGSENDKKLKVANTNTKQLQETLTNERATEQTCILQSSRLKHGAAGTLKRLSSKRQPFDDLL